MSKNPHAVLLGRLGGLKGGIARAKLLSPEKRKLISQKAATARWETGRFLKKDLEFEQRGKRLEKRISDLLYFCAFQDHFIHVRAEALTILEILNSIETGK